MKSFLLASIFSLQVGFLAGWYAAAALQPLHVVVHLESVGVPVESGIAARREAMRALGVDVNPVD
jgi:hypothetical protein